MRKLATVLGTTALLLSLGSPALAQTEMFELSIPVTGYFTEEGVVASKDVPSRLQGAACEVVAEADNNESVRPGTDLTVTSNGSTVVLRDVEREAGAVTIVAAGTLILGSDITVSVSFGSDPQFSGGFIITASCEVEEPEPVNHPRASIEGPTCEDHTFTVTLDNEDSDEAQTFEIQLNGLKANSISVQAGESKTFTRHAVDGDRLQVFVDAQLAEANADLGDNVCGVDKPDKPKHPHIGTAIHGRNGHGKHYGGTAMTGLNDNQKALAGAMFAFLIVGGLSLVAARKRERNN